MRKFKRLNCQVCVFVAAAVAGVHIELKPVDPVLKLDIFRAEGIGVDFVYEADAQEPVLLRLQHGKLALKFLPALPTLLLRVLRLGAEHLHKPIGKFHVFDLYFIEKRQDLAIKLRLRDPDARVTWLSVLCTTVVDVFFRAILRLLGFQFARDWVAAMSAADEFTRVGEFVRVVILLAQEHLHAVPCSAVYDGLMNAVEPLALMLHLPDVSAVVQHPVQLAAGKARQRVGIHSAFGLQRSNERVERVIVIGVKLEDAFNAWCLLRMKFDQASPVLAHIDIAIRRTADKQAALDAPRKPLAHVKALLLGIEACHVREYAALHAAGGTVLGGLRDIDHAHAMLKLEALKLDVIEKIAGRAVNLIEKNAVQLLGVLLRIRHEFFKGVALVILAGGFGNAEQLDDSSIAALGEGLQSIFLNVEAEAFALLFPA